MTFLFYLQIRQFIYFFCCLLTLNFLFRRRILKEKKEWTNFLNLPFSNTNLNEHSCSPLNFILLDPVTYLPSRWVLTISQRRQISRSASKIVNLPKSYCFSITIVDLKGRSSPNWTTMGYPWFLFIFSSNHFASNQDWTHYTIKNQINSWIYWSWLRGLARLPAKSWELSQFIVLGTIACGIVQKSA